MISVATRVRDVLGPAGRPCGLCGSRRVLLMRSWDRPGALDRLRRRLGADHDQQERFTDECRDCGSRASVRPSPAELPLRALVRPADARA